MTLLDALYLPAAVITAPWWARKTRSGWRERFGHIDRLPAKEPGTRRVLLHAVSVGEVNTLRGLVPMLRERGLEVVVSAMTDTGLKRATELFAHQPGVHVVRFCLDFSPAVHRFLAATEPDLVALVELEVWPNFVRACRERNIPVGVINGRLSARSFRGYRLLRPFFKRTFSSLTFAAAQDSDYAQRFTAMGVPSDRLTITGSMKWDAIPGTATLRVAVPEVPSDLQSQADQLARDLGIDRTKPLIVAGSTAPIEGPWRARTGFDCEEAMLHAACPAGTQLLCAPRKPEHYEKAFAALGGPANCTRRSNSSTPPPPHSPSRFLLDTIGELRAAYALADVAVIGRTFGTLGGSDPIEPIALGKPTILGPRYHNFESIVQTFAASGAIVITEADKLPAELRDLLANPAHRQKLATQGAAAIAAQQGATQRHADLILRTLSNVPGPSGSS